ncbi:MAG TPA: YifB family Mg chelatase-like AAA ATPase [Steroidobacteraceae bacterium]|jgi:magnesium chelatase family protein|nr:YifB family Mg chelatase-like AAA ATPase [Steroidobacteraceae bacterium]
MSVARVLSRTEFGLDAPLVQVEVHLSAGLPAFTIVGLPARVVSESRERVRAALLNSGYQFPPRRITVNLAPVELSKQGGRFDLPIALGLLIASGQLQPRSPQTVECYGELGLAGELKPVAGLFLAALHASRAGHALIVPSASAAEVALSGHAAAAALSGERPASGISLISGTDPALSAGGTGAGARGTGPDSVASLADVVGQWQAKRALLIAAAGAHSMLMTGPPGSGKSMLAARLPGLLPPLSRAEALELAGVVALSGARLDPQRWRTRPFRSPHHTASAHAVVGGGPGVRPGEISLAHHGVLFLDELPEFDRRVLEALREPLESGTITIARAARSLTLPARFQLIAAMNPCPCGYLGDPLQDCRCSPSRIERYRQRVSGPLLDRIDIRVTVPRLPPAELARAIGIGVSGGDALEAAMPQAAVPEATVPGSPDPAARVCAARARRVSRSGELCAFLSAAELRCCCTLRRDAAALLRRSCQRLAISARGMQRLLALSRTIADLADSDIIEAAHIAEAIQLRRPLERRR